MSQLITRQLDVSISGQTVCKQLELVFSPGQIWGILGRNGVGKTTLLHTLAGLRNADSGNILLNDSKLTELSRKQTAQKIGLLLQHTDDAFPSTVLETVVMGRHPHIPALQWESRQDYEIAEQALTTVDLSDLKHRQVNQLSGGERQRVSIAALIAQDPNIFLLDEPNSHLDLHHQITLLTKLTDYAIQHLRVMVMSLHDINLVAKYCDHVLLLLGDGNYLAGPTQSILNESNLESVFQHPIRQYQFGQHQVYFPD